MTHDPKTTEPLTPSQIAAKRGALLRKARWAEEMSNQYAREAQRLEREASGLEIENV